MDNEEKIKRLDNMSPGYWQVKSVDRRLVDPTNIKGKYILDVGCGNGYDSLLFTSYGAKVVGIDISPESIKTSQKNSKIFHLDDSVQFEVGDATKLRFPSNSFDIVYSFSVIDHIPTGEGRQQAINEMARVVKPEGHVVNTGPNLFFLPGTILTKYAQIKGSFKSFEHRFTYFEMRDMLKKANLKIVSFDSEYLYTPDETICNRYCSSLRPIFPLFSTPFKKLNDLKVLKIFAPRIGFNAIKQG